MLEEGRIRLHSTASVTSLNKIIINDDEGDLVTSNARPWRVNYNPSLSTDCLDVCTFIIFVRNCTCRNYCDNRRCSSTNRILRVDRSKVEYAKKTIFRWRNRRNLFLLFNAPLIIPRMFLPITWLGDVILLIAFYREGEFN